MCSFLHALARQHLELLKSLETCSLFLKQKEETNEGTTHTPELLVCGSLMKIPFHFMKSTADGSGRQDPDGRRRWSTTNHQ